MTLRDFIAKRRQDYCFAVLFKHRGSVSAAARELGVHRNTLHKILKEKP